MCVSVCVFISHRSLFQICFANDNGIFEAICTTYSNVLPTNLLGLNHMICANDLRKLHKYAYYFIHFIQIQTAKYFESILIWIIGSNCGPNTRFHILTISSQRECCWFANSFSNSDVYDNVGTNSIVFHTRLCFDAWRKAIRWMNNREREKDRQIEISWNFHNRQWYIFLYICITWEIRLHHYITRWIVNIQDPSNTKLHKI